MGKLKLGKAFPDQLAKTTLPHGHFHGKQDDSSWKDTFLFGWNELPKGAQVTDKRKLSFVLLFIIVFFLLFLRVFHLQIVNGSDNRSLADSNRIQVKIIHAPRGVIYDRNGQILAQNEPGFRLIEPGATNSNHQYLSRDESLRMEIENDPRAKYLEIDNLRSYPFKEQLAHVLGYTGEISPAQLKDPNFQNYKAGDRVGQAGIEQIYEKVLRGIDGGEIIEVDAQGQKLRTLSRVEPIPGQDLYLSIDSNLQKVAYKNLEDGIKKSGSCCGSAIVEDPNTGQLLALVSYPSYDPTDISASLTDPTFPLLNRTIAGNYPPGSTFKIASSLAGLSSGKITPTTSFEDTGVLQLGPYSFANWYFSEYGQKEAGSVDLVRALQRSNDIFFYRLGQLTGEQVIADSARRLGLGKELGIDLPGEIPGLIPDNAWKVKQFNQQWFPGDTLHMAIGQGFVLVTPLQISYLISEIATDGKQYPPHLALKITDSNKKIIKQYSYDPDQIKGIKSSDVALVKKGLEQVPVMGGTAWPFFTFPIPTAGKTGTAEFGDPKNKTHAWYTSYGPVDKPQIAVTVLVEAGGEGSSVAGPISKEIYRYYFSPDKNHLIPDITPQFATDSARKLGE